MTARQLTDLPHDQQHLVQEVSGRLAPRFAGVFGPETIQRLVVDSMDQLLATAKTTAFLPLLTERFARERLQALGKLEGSLPSAVPAVLFLCVHNAGRSQMAAGWMRHLAGDRVVVYSGGSEPASEINAAVVEAMDRRGRPCRRCGDHHGMRGRLSAVSRETLRRLGARRSCGARHRVGPSDPRRDQNARRSALGIANGLHRLTRSRAGASCRSSPTTVEKLSDEVVRVAVIRAGTRGPIAKAVGIVV
jgi:hypothetical protein